MAVPTRSAPPPHFPQHHHILGAVFISDVFCVWLCHLILHGIVPNETTARSRRGNFPIKCAVLRKITKNLLLILLKDQSLNLSDSGTG